ncbi:unnamed protein product [marine sediment metagenome]|uniref:Uncharacterized protein n=1 Tax=marine sediment metagenome TaxID=412755 RepID=X1SC92_9ZZZZ
MWEIDAKLLLEAIEDVGDGKRNEKKMADHYFPLDIDDIFILYFSIYYSNLNTIINFFIKYLFMNILFII